jgi:hypothetical protein
LIFVKDLIRELQTLDQDKPIGILYTDDKDDTFFPSIGVCISKEEDMEDEIKWKNGGYYMY